MIFVILSFNTRKLPICIEYLENKAGEKRQKKKKNHEERANSRYP